MEQTSPSTIALTTPLQNIGMAFSGGGFRAASFSLGALSYLNRIPISENRKLLQQVSFISSASGGTITNAVYTSCLHRGESFDHCYAFLHQQLSGDGLLNAALETLNNDKEWGQAGNEKQRNIINAFAKVYDRLLFKGETLGVYWNKAAVAEFEVCFNATEFYRGLSFRFQVDGTGNPYQVIGNTYLRFDTTQLETVKKIKLADILAASSCFPMGFEPIVYPGDYTYAAGEKPLNKKELQDAVIYESYDEHKYRLSDITDNEKNKNPKEKQPKYLHAFGLMDGGITDNQGLNSIMLADKRRRQRANPNPFDLIIVTDVASYFMNAYEVPQAKDEPEWRRKNIAYYIQQTRNNIKKIKGSILLVVLLLLASIATLVFCNNNIANNIAWLVIGLSIAILVPTLLLSRVSIVRTVFNNPEQVDIQGPLQNTLHIEKFFSSTIVARLIRFLKLTRLGVWEQMLKARITSVMTMVSDVNLKQVRRLIYQIFYEEPMWDNRRMPNFIYEISTFNISARTNRLNDERRLKWKATEADKQLLLDNCSLLNAVAEEARLMSTTLWFDETDTQQKKLKKIIATGQFTTCVNLIEYLISLERKGLVFEQSVQQQLDAIKKELINDWEHFKHDPYFLYNETNK